MTAGARVNPQLGQEAPGAPYVSKHDGHLLGSVRSPSVFGNRGLWAGLPAPASVTLRIPLGCLAVSLASVQLECRFQTGVGEEGPQGGRIWLPRMEGCAGQALTSGRRLRQLLIETEMRLDGSSSQSTASPLLRIVVAIRRPS